MNLPPRGRTSGIALLLMCTVASCADGRPQASGAELHEAYSEGHGIGSAFEEELRAVEVGSRAFNAYMDNPPALEQDTVCFRPLEMLRMSQDDLDWQDDTWYTDPDSEAFGEFVRGCQAAPVGDYDYLDG